MSISFRIASRGSGLVAEVRGQDGGGASAEVRGLYGGQLRDDGTQAGIRGRVLVDDEGRVTVICDGAASLQSKAAVKVATERYLQGRP